MQKQRSLFSEWMLCCKDSTSMKHFQMMSIFCMSYFLMLHRSFGTQYRRLVHLRNIPSVEMAQNRSLSFTTVSYINYELRFGWSWHWHSVTSRSPSPGDNNTPSPGTDERVVSDLACCVSAAGTGSETSSARQSK
jgi:hypothetical protein